MAEESEREEVIYVIVAHRWGLRDAHSYVVGALTDKNRAIVWADAHVEYRGGKYGCEVVECDENIERDGNGGIGLGEAKGAQVYYKECPYYGAAGRGGASCQPADSRKETWTLDPEGKVNMNYGGKEDL